MRSIWKGSLAFGLVNVPVKVYSATEDQDIRFHQVHAKDGGRIRYRRVCEECNETVEFGDIDKAYSSEDGRTVVLTAEDFASLPVEESREIEVLSFVPADQIDPMMYDKSYYLEPASKSTKAYVLLQRTLADTDRLAIVHFALRQKTRLAALRVVGDVLMVQTLLWPDEIRAAEFASLDAEVKISPQEQKMALSLVDSFADDFHPENFTDSYREELEQLLTAKLEGGEAFPAKEVEEGEDAEVVDLLAALQRSVQRRGEAGDGGETKSQPAKKPAAKTTAKKSSDDEKPAAKAPRKRATTTAVRKTS